MSDNKYEALFNLIMDITTCIHMPLKIFAFYVIVRHTPPQLRHYSYFTLNTMFWNFLCNFVTAFVHFYPLFPALCFRADGIASYFIENENFGYWLFILMAFLTAECSFALIFAFPHRYFVFVHPKLAARIRPAWVFALCAAAHVIFGLLYFPITSGLTVLFKNYSNMAESDTLFDFCLNPNVTVNAAVMYMYGAGVAFGILVIVASVNAPTHRSFRKHDTKETPLGVQLRQQTDALLMSHRARILEVLKGRNNAIVSFCSFAAALSPWAQAMESEFSFSLCVMG